MPTSGFPFVDVVLGRSNSTPNLNTQGDDHNLFAEKITILKNELVLLEASGLGDDFDTAFGL